MRKLLAVIVMTFSVFGVCAQKKEIAIAKDWVKKGTNLVKAEQMMTGLLGDSVNRANVKIWTVLFDAIKKQYDQGNERLYLRQPYDTAELFVLGKKMFTTLEGLDSLDAKPDRKGRIRPKMRDKHAELLNGYRANLFNGGMFFINRHDYGAAYDFFHTYLNCANQPLFVRYRYAETDRQMPQAAYWAVYCGYKLKNPKATLRHTYLALKDTAHYNYMLQYLAETYRIEKDTARYVEMLTEGFEKYPKFPFFFPRLITYYSEKGEMEEAMKVADRALAVDSTSVIFRFAKSSLLLNVGHYAECIRLCDELIAVNDSLADAYLNAGLAYFNQGIELDKSTAASSKRRQAVQAYYRQALPYLQKYRALAPDQRNKWGIPLYTIYLNLNMGKEFDEIDRMMKTN
nr:hypothetical protein [Hoylesella enoeca]